MLVVLPIQPCLKIRTELHVSSGGIGLEPAQTIKRESESTQLICVYVFFGEIEK